MIKSSRKFLNQGGYLMFCQSSMADFDKTEKNWLIMVTALNLFIPKEIFLEIITLPKKTLLKKVN